MKRSTFLAATLGALLASSPVAAQHEHGNRQPEAKQDHVSAMMGQPTFEQTTGGLNIRVWLITQERHREMMKQRMAGGQENDMKGMDHYATHGMGMMGGMHGKHKEQSAQHGTAEGMKHDGGEMDMRVMMAGTHHIMVVLNNEDTKAEQKTGEVDIHISPPAGRDSSVALTRMMNHFGGGLILDESGRYVIAMTVREGRTITTAHFEYEVESAKE